MKKISVYLDDKTEEHLNQIMTTNLCTISDAVCMAITVLAQERNRVFYPVPTLWQKVKATAHSSKYGNIYNLCGMFGIKVGAARALCKRVELGSGVGGFGDSNKWRNKQDNRTLRTHTAYIATVFKKHLNIDLEAL